MRPILFVLVVAAACNKSGGDRAPRGSSPAPTSPPTGAPVQTEPPNAAWQEPAFPGQTRAPKATSDVAFDVAVVAEGLSHPWALAFLPDGAMLVTERPGRLRIVTPDGTLSEPVAGLPEVDARDQGGLLDVALAPDFDTSNQIYWSYSEPREGGNGTAVARGTLVRGDAPRVEDVDVIWRMTPTLASTMHFGSRLVFTPDGNLFITTGERSILEGRRQAQQPGSAFGKIIRVQPDGSPPADNPLVGKQDALPTIWSWGHRNIQAATLHPDTNELWVVDHGPRGGDEINVAEKGKDYGWPTITYGIEYSGEKIGEGITKQEGMEQPIYYWDPVIGPSGATFYDADLFPAWRGNLFVGGLATQDLVRLTVDGRRVTGEERLLADRGDRIRDVVVGPDGAIYVVTDEDPGQVLKLVPR